MKTSEKATNLANLANFPTWRIGLRKLIERFLDVRACVIGLRQTNVRRLTTGVASLQNEHVGHVGQMIAIEVGDVVRTMKKSAGRRFARSVVGCGSNEKSLFTERLSNAQSQTPTAFLKGEKNYLAFGMVMVGFYDLNGNMLDSVGYGCGNLSVASLKQGVSTSP